MKKIIYLFLLTFISFIGCSNDSGTATDPFGGGGGTGAVTITVSIVQDNQGQNHFQFIPSTSVVVIQVRIQCAPQQVDQTVQGDGQTVFTTAEGFSIGPVDQGLLQTGQQWTFNIQGKIGSSTGTDYNVNSNLIVP